MKSIELGITFGYQIIIENVGRDLDPSLDPVLLQPVALGIKKIQVGDKTLEYSDSFRLCKINLNKKIKKLISNFYRHDDHTSKPSLLS
jgi:hypothetical protein